MQNAVRTVGAAIAGPFDLKAAFLARHAQHVVLIHFPIALFMAAVLFDCLGQWKKSQVLIFAAYCNLLLAALSTVPVVLSGLAAWHWVLEGQPLKGILRWHLLLGCSSATLIWLVFLLHHYGRRSEGHSPPKLRLPMEIIGVLLVALTAHLGGFLSGVNGA
jgi:uncharacterized membrane protein